jgi:oligopeptide/dipeptide ABC transporter ATP-binding protein
MTYSRPILEVNNLKTHFKLEQGTVRAVDGASFKLYSGQTLGIVGESGCGKSVMSRSVLRIEPQPGEIVDGTIHYHRQMGDGKAKVVDLAQLDPRGTEIRSIRGAEISMVFQEPMTSLSPVHTIGNQIMEIIVLHQGLDERQARDRTIEMLKLVGMPRAERVIDRYPHQLSGGMRQRAMIAMALACTPRILIADEPTTALDVTTQAQILNLMRQLQAELGMAIMFITHDLGVIAQMTEYVIVMYLGKVVEAADVDSIFYKPKHPYTHALLHSIPRLGQRHMEKRLSAIEGSIPDPFSVPRGCPFHPRCPFSDGKRCREEVPQTQEIAPSHTVACHYAEDLTLSGVDGVSTHA